MSGVGRLLKSACPLCLKSRTASTDTTINMKDYVIAAKKKRGFLNLVPSNQSMALQHFDTYYNQIYGSDWPRIRLALLSPQMYMAVINNFSAEAEQTIADLQRLRYEDFVPSVRRSAKNFLQEAVVEQKEKVEEVQEELVGERTIKLSSISRVLSEASRTNLNEFVPVTEVTTEHDLLVRLDKNSPLSSPFVEWADAEAAQTSGDLLPTVAELNFDISPTLKLFVAGQGGHVNRLPTPRLGANGLAPYLPLNGASAMPVLALNLRPGDSVLDLCAAPGGKTVLMLQSQLPQRIVCVDSSSSRLGRLRAVVDSHGLPRSVQDRDLVLVHGNGCKIDLGSGYDKVLVDVPCSTDRHAVTKSDSIFAKNRSDERLKLPTRQAILLERALRAVRIGGEVVYSTCTLSVNQNDAVVREVGRRLEGEMSLGVVELSHLRHALTHLGFWEPPQQQQRRQLGLTVVPFLQQNYGPSYVCKIRRTG